MADQHAKQCLIICGSQVRLCLARRDYVRAQILIRKVSARAFAERPDKKGQAAGEVGIEGTTIEEPDAVNFGAPPPHWPIARLDFALGSVSLYTQCLCMRCTIPLRITNVVAGLLYRCVTTCWHQNPLQPHCPTDCYRNF